MRREEFFRNIVLILRSQAWQRAKAELLGMLSTFWPSVEMGHDELEAFDITDKLIREFIANMEGEEDICPGQ